MPQSAPNVPSLRRRLALPSLLAGTCSVVLACAPESSSPEGATVFRTTTTNHTTYQPGDIPILITVPHGGNAAPANVSPRTTSFPDFETSRELHLQDLALGVAARLDTTYGVVPYLVLGESHRQYIDYNRDELDTVSSGLNEAYEDGDANVYYDEYHSRIAGYVTSIQGTHGSGLLIDMHGQTSLSDKIVRGTRNGDAIWQLLSGHAVTSITASEQPYAGETAAMAHDGDLNTRWRSFGTNEWIEFDLGASKTIGSVEIAITEGDSRLYQFEIEVWNGSSWVVAYDGTNVQDTSDFEIYDFGTPITGSKVRMSCHGSNVSQANYVKEIRIQEHGWDPIVGPDSVFGELAADGYSLEPTNSEIGVGAETTLIGGFTVDHHGSENGGLDAFQLEIGGDYRDTQGERDQLVIDLADAIYSYHATYQ